MIKEGLQNNSFVEKILTKKLPKIKKRRKSPIKIVVDKHDELKVDNKVTRSEAYKLKVLKRSDNTINVLNYINSREKVAAQCNVCGYEWKIRSDHLLSRPYCPSCRKNE
ncbi:hypothetical protein ACTSEZ_01465 [Metabacillus sp. JX24]|uniref:hypothetical protein n=1 Tax=Metabacillus sp. JX24 TaxID=3240759 RepID=UPI00350EFCD1